MKSDRKSIRGIVDELMDNALKARANSVQVEVESQGKEVMIRVTDDGEGLFGEELEKARGKLAQPRRYELDQYYGSLAGKSALGSGLSIIGMMTDRAEIQSRPGKGTVITVYMKLNDSK